VRSPASDPIFRKLYRQLLLSYLAVISAIFAVLGVTLYQRMTVRLYDQFDRELAVAIRTGIEIFPLVSHEYHEHLGDLADAEAREEFARASAGNLRRISVAELLDAYRDDDAIVDGASDALAGGEAPIGSVRIDATLEEIDRSVDLNKLTLEWYDADLTRMLIESEPQGEIASSGPPDVAQLDRAIGDGDSIRRWTSAVYNRDRQILGYVRASGSTDAIAAELDRLAFELGWEAILALALAAVSGQWLTRRALKPIAQSFEQLRRFTADASHELRSPLTSISTTLSTLRRRPDTLTLADCQRNLRRITQASDRMNVLVEDLLLLARVDGGLSIATEVDRRFSLDELLDNLIDEFEPIAERHDVALRFVLPDAREVAPALWDVCGNPQHLERAFFNLIDNAIHYTPAGGSVTVTMARSEAKAIVRVRDTGIGIAASDLPHLFDRFWRADAARTRRSNGSGLGLSIVATIVREHGGSIDVESEVGRGSCFRVQLPATAFDKRRAIETTRSTR